jgi:cardiolipin synthase
MLNRCCLATGTVAPYDGRRSSILHPYRKTPFRGDNMNGSKALADALTLSRTFLGAVLPWFGLVSSPKSLPLDLSAVVAWTTDVLDGAVARRDPNPRQTRVGEHDLLFDVWVVIGVSDYLAFAGYISPLAAGAYHICAGLVAAYLRSKAFAKVVQAVPYAILLLIGLLDAPLYGLLALVWMGPAIAITWPRFPREQVPEFLAEVRDLLGNQRRTP